MDVVQDMPLTKANFFRAVYPRQSRDELICVTAYSSKCAATGVLATEKSVTVP